MVDVIQAGDIFLFEAPQESLLSRCIAALTNSTVSHTAVYCGENKIIEMGSTGIMENSISLVAEGQKTYVMRLNSHPDGSPIVTNAKKYLKQEVKYDYVSLFILCGLIIYREHHPTSKWQKVANFALRLGLKKLDELLNQQLNKSKKPVMMCSQLAYQSYLDSGKKYRIRFKQSLLEEQDQFSVNSGVRIADQLVDLPELDTFSNAEAQPVKDISNDKLAQKMLEAFEEEQAVNDQLDTATTWSPEVLKLAKQFLDTAEKWLEKINPDIPLESLFVTPADLLEHSSNLEQVAEVGTKRIW